MQLSASSLFARLFAAVNVFPSEQRVEASGSRGGCIKACHDIHLALPHRTFVGENARREFWSLFQSQVVPQCRVQPESASEVADILGIIRAQKCRFAVLGGGTSPFFEASNAQDGVTIDLGLMNTVTLIRMEPPVIEVGGGAVWADVYRELDSRNLSAAGTRNSLTGVVGSILGGGISFFSQHHGWICDTVLEFQLVLANGSAIRASETVNPDLFWALRGGGANFGIVTSVTMEAFPQEPSWYTFQLWNMTDMKSVFRRLGDFSRLMPPDVQMIASNLGWSSWKKEFVLSDRIVASAADIPEIANVDTGKEISQPVEEHLYRRTTLQMAEVMDLVNEFGYFNFFGSITVRSDPEIHVKVAEIFEQEANKILDVVGVKTYIVYNPLTASTIRKMQLRGGNALGLKEQDGPLTIVNINLHWSHDSDTHRLRHFMSQMLTRIERAAKEMDLYHPYLFLSHAYEEQQPLITYGEENLLRLRQVRRAVDPDGIFQLLQVGQHKLGIEDDADENRREL